MIASRLVIVALVAVILGYSAYGATVHASYGIATDFKVLWDTSRTATPYASAYWPFAYPPTMLLWLKPLNLLPNVWTAFLLWGLFSSACYAFAARPLIGNWWPLALLSLPGSFALVTGQVSIFVAAMMFVAFRCRQTGLILGLAFTLKPQLVFLAPIAFVVLRDWKQLGSMSATIAAVSLLTTAAFGPHIWMDWISSLDHFHQRALELGVLYNAASPAAQAELLGFNPLPFLAAGLLVGIAVLAKSFELSVMKGPMLALCCILGSPYSLNYDLVAVMPLAIPYLRQMSWRTVPATLVPTFFQIPGLLGLALAEIQPTLKAQGHHARKGAGLASRID